MGSYAPHFIRCEKRKCNLGEILNDDGLCSVVRCQNGFEPGPSGSCVDIDECRDYDNMCRVGETCENTMGSYRCVGQCELGLRVDPGTGRCRDVDECATGIAACFGGKACVNTIGSYRCECPRGFRESSAESGSGKACDDIDECAEASVCGIDSQCKNSPGSYRCVCKAGFQRRDGRCSDIDECREIR